MNDEDRQEIRYIIRDVIAEMKDKLPCNENRERLAKLEVRVNGNYSTAKNVGDAVFKIWQLAFTVITIIILVLQFRR